MKQPEVDGATSVPANDDYDPSLSGVITRRGFLLWAAGIGLATTGFSAAISAAGKFGEWMWTKSVLDRNPNYVKNLAEYITEWANNPALQEVNRIRELHSPQQQDHLDRVIGLLEAFGRTTSLPNGLNKIKVEVSLEHPFDTFDFSFQRVKVMPPPFRDQSGLSKTFDTRYNRTDSTDVLKRLSGRNASSQNVARIEVILQFDPVNMNIDRLPDPFPTMLKQEEYNLTDPSGHLHHDQFFRTYFGLTALGLAEVDVDSLSNEEKSLFIAKGELHNYYLGLSNGNEILSEYVSTRSYRPNGQIVNPKEHYTSNFNWDSGRLWPTFFDTLAQEYLITLLQDPPAGEQV